MNLDNSPATIAMTPLTYTMGFASGNSVFKSIDRWAIAGYYRYVSSCLSTIYQDQNCRQRAGISFDIDLPDCQNSDCT